jgi:transposase
LPLQADIQAEALAGVHDAAVQMIDTSVVRAPGRVLHRGQQGRAVSIKLSIVGVATRYDKLAANYLAFVKLACIRLWLRVYEFTTW